MSDPLIFVWRLDYAATLLAGVVEVWSFDDAYFIHLRGVDLGLAGEC